jgi:endonuclease/exonuclease/phosphatase family metal-dependent hydrolase
MRLLSYNILDGGTDRLDLLLQVISAQNPDIIALVEADDPRIVEKISERLEMDSICGDGRKHGAAILSRWRIFQSINHALLRPEFADACLEATIDRPGGASWTIAAIHLHARARESDEDIRLREIDAILDIFADRRQRNVPHILAGDFNANSPIQIIDPQKCKPRTREDFAANGGKLPRRAVEKLLADGYLDSLQAVRGDEAGKIGSFTTEYPGQRVDYIFTFGIDPQTFADAKVVQDDPAAIASDHFPAFLQIA